MPHDSEVEIKLIIDPGDVKSLLALPMLRAAGPPGRSRLLTTYFDTPDGTLSKAGLHLRVRERSGTWLQTVKSTRAGLERGEWERRIGSPSPSDSVGDDGPGDRLLRRKAIRAALEPRFRIEVERTTWALQRNGAQLDCVLDEGSIIAGEARRPICEVELELEEGDPEVLFGVAEDIGAALPVALSLTSKGRRGFRLASRQDDTVEKPDPALHAGMTAAEGARAVLLSTLAALLDMLILLRSGPSAELVHQTRVALRRLRAGLTLFRRVLDPDAAERLKPGLSTLSRLLGDARDIDVLLQSLESRDDGSASFRALHDGLIERRDAAYAALATAVRGAAHVSLMLGVLHLAAGLGTQPHRLGTRRLGRHLARVFEARTQALLKSSRRLRRLSPEERHAVRIRAKKLRYMIEFSASLAPRRRYRAMRDLLEQIQERLGELNDVAVARELMQQVTHDAQAAELFAPRDRPASRAALDAAVAARRRLKRVKPFWSDF